MKIVIASGIYPPDIGGPATYSRLIAREFIKRNINVSLICYSDKEDEPFDREEKFKIVRVVRKKFFLFRYLSYFFNLYKLARHCDVVYAQGPLGAGLPAIAVSRILGKKFVIKIVGDYAWEQGVNQFGVKDSIEEFQTRRYDRKTESIWKIQKGVVKSADKIITPSQFLKKIIKGWGAKEQKINVIYNAGPEISFIEKIEKKPNQKGDILISSARLEPWKGMTTLVEIMPDLLKKNPNFKLVIVGSGPEGEKIKILIRNLHLEKEIELIDKVPHEELMAYFKASKIFILNTGYEGLPHIILEAMACNLSVITTNVCGNPEVVENGYNGLLVEYNNKTQLKEAILKLWSEEKIREKFVKNSKEILKKFTIEEMINKTIKTLNF